MFRFGKVFITFLLGIGSVDASIEVVIDGKKYTNQQNIELNADYHELVFVFPRGKNYNYHFKLENLENNWKFGDSPQVRYTNLSGGNYIFRGRILNGRNILHEKSVSVHIQENFGRNGGFGFSYSFLLHWVFSWLFIFGSYTISDKK